MADLTSIDRLQPCLLDRLFDHEPRRLSESRHEKVVSIKRFMEGIKRDIEWLLNSSSHFYNLDEQYSEVGTSVLNYGIRDFTGLSSENLDLKTLENVIHESLTTFEPRLIADELEVKAVRSTSSSLTKVNAISFEIYGKIWADPLPQDFVLRTEASLDTGVISVV